MSLEVDSRGGLGGVGNLENIYATEVDVYFCDGASNPLVLTLPRLQVILSIGTDLQI